VSDRLLSFSLLSVAPPSHYTVRSSLPLLLFYSFILLSYATHCAGTRRSYAAQRAPGANASLDRVFVRFAYWGWERGQEWLQGETDKRTQGTTILGVFKT
jgi:hypothetical protein